MDEVKLTVRLSAADRQALRLHAVLQGRSVQDVVTGLIQAELSQGSPSTGVSREQFVADLYARRGVDPADPAHQAIEQRAKDSIRSAGTAAAAADRGAA